LILNHLNIRRFSRDITDSGRANWNPIGNGRATVAYWHCCRLSKDEYNRARYTLYFSEASDALKIRLSSGMSRSPLGPE
jgi:hypothetical protein